MGRHETRVESSERTKSREGREKKREKKRRRSSSSSSSSTTSSSSVSSPSPKKHPRSSSKSQDKNQEKKKPKRKRTSSSSSSSGSSSSSSSESTDEETKKKRKMRKAKKKLKKMKAREKKKAKKARQKEKKKMKKLRRMSEKGGDAGISQASSSQVPSEKPPSFLETWQAEGSAEHGPVMTDEQKARLSTRRPLTKEEWEAQQSIIRRVVDPETGRTRLVRGEGEILEEIVSREKHKDINKQATKGDGSTFQKRLGLNH
ncbi:ADP-ribosylation factor-like protein 6-interacting protein 4 [Scleropages formosus]|uniref:ADP-ribosylation factor-like protein 6-interacting protein 4 n=1 Tax=Scleropages formosus TaxID=113540 RepID=A0A8C9SKW3_SCLFO|nr:ADP-ribosylation factor-like protein 6-interacting protein 4 [Scleropages formosus]